MTRTCKARAMFKLVTVLVLQVDIVDTETRKTRLQADVTQQEGDLQSRMESVAKAEAAIKRTNGEIERRTKEIVMLNRKYEKLVANMEPGEHVGAFDVCCKD